MRKDISRRIIEAVDERDELEGGPTPTVDDLVGLPDIDMDDPSEMLGAAYDSPEPDEPEELEEGKRGPTKKELDAEAKLVHGGLSQTSKMPCKSFSLGAGITCPAGTQMVKKDPHAVCRVCFAKSGREVMPKQRANKKARLELLKKALRSTTARDRWLAEMVGSIQRQGPYFRWHDSGDIFRPEYLDLLVDVIRGTPDTLHWIPTKQEKWVKDWVARHGDLPENVNIRISAMLLNEEKNQPKPFTASSVYISKAPETSYPCPATWDSRFILRHGRRIKTKAGPGVEPTCGPCRACWDTTVPQVCYRYHGAGSKLPDDLQQEFKGRRDIMGPILKKLRAK